MNKQDASLYDGRQFGTWAVRDATKAGGLEKALPWGTESFQPPPPPPPHS